MNGMNEEEFLKSSAANNDGKPDAEGKDAGNINTDADVSNESEINQGDSADKLTPTQQEAYDMGWRPKEEFNGDPDNWSSASAFMRYQKLTKKIEQQKNDFDKRINENNELNKGLYNNQIDSLKKQLEEKRDEAVEEGDIDAYKKKQKQIDELTEQQHKASNTNQPSEATVLDDDIQEWLLSNPWMRDASKKSEDASDLFDRIRAHNPYKTTKENLAILDDELKIMAVGKKINPNRMSPSSLESGGSRPPAKNRELTMSELSEGEKNAWREFGKTIHSGNEKSFLASVKKVREERKSS